MPEPDKRFDPSALRFLIGHDLRVARERVSKTQVEAARILGCAQSRINSLETAKIQQQPDEVDKLLTFYGVGVAHRDRITSLAARADQTTWWAPFRDVLPGWFKTFVGLEGLATAAFTYEPQLLPGQLQTADYATAQLDGDLRVAPRDVPQVVRARMARQRLAGVDNLRFRAVIEEHVLERMIGGPQVMRGQLEHLIELMRLDNVELHVMPTAVAVHDGLDGDFMLLDFCQAQSIGYIEYPSGALYVQEEDLVEEYRMVADRLCRTALSTADSADFIQSRIEILAAQEDQGAAGEQQ
ncbi:helix-turn-helix domain-containing protein [Nocardia uniformis]|uniref:Helix-turn-helix domain-containing protein n=1 Tax=Nocardia uniformis TaxID=53432 RepID=A0A849C7Q7_9NOCA|nr:helix-turn-helix transcriptional regulator [Nocardia uniformis]NNH73816.1 helix-turn-helix domain-containing protein [Nocardia uniformis]